MCSQVSGDRLGRSLRELLETVEGFRTHGLALRSLEEQLDAGSAAGELVFHVFGKNRYPPGEDRLPGLRWVADLSDVRTGVVRIRGGVDGDHHRG